jgi:hypothetical protein
MRNKYSFTFLFCFVLSQAIGQSTKKVSVYLAGQFSTTTYTDALDNSSMGPGFGVQTFINTKSKFKPIVDLTADLLMNESKVYVLANEGKEMSDGTMVNFFVGGSYHPNQSIFLSIAGGPSLFNGRAIAGLKGSFGFYFSKTQRWIGKVSAIHLFNQEPLTNGALGVVSFGIGLRLN